MQLTPSQSKALTASLGHQFDTYHSAKEARQNAPITLDQLTLLYSFINLCTASHFDHIPEEQRTILCLAAGASHFWPDVDTAEACIAYRRISVALAKLGLIPNWGLTKV
jgi:hypothetical protein